VFDRERAREKPMPEKKAFIAEEERPEVRIDPEVLLTDLRVRDLNAILGQANFKSRLKDIKIEKIEKPEKFEKLEKFEKHEKFEKPEKFEKLERIEEVKWLTEPIPKPREPVVDGPEWDPRIAEGINQMVQSVTQLTAQVRDLTVRLDKLERG
jgi:hypothetical protein